MEEQPSQAAQLLQQAKLAIRKKDYAQARGILEALVKIDDLNEEAWMLLATIASNNDDRRTYLGNVILINPQNEQALKMLDKLEGKPSYNPIPSFRGGGGRKVGLPLLLGLLGLVVVGGLCALLLLVLSGGDDEEAALPTLAPTGVFTDTPQPSATSAPADAAGTDSSATPPTTAPTRVTSLATWTPSPGPTASPTAMTLPPPPAELPGRILMQSGRVAGDAENQPLVLVAANDPSSAQTVSGEGQRGQNPALDPNGNRFTWSRFESSSSVSIGRTLTVQNFGVGTGINLLDFYQGEGTLIEPNDPAWFGNTIVFTAQLFGSEKRDLWLFRYNSMEAPFAEAAFIDPSTYNVSGASLVALTRDSSAELPSPAEEGTATEAAPATEEENAATPSPTLPPTASATPEPGAAPPMGALSFSDPTFSPNGSAVLVVGSFSGIADLYSLNIESGALLAVTQNGNRFVESDPDWGVYQGRNEIIFASQDSSSGLSVIYLVPADLSADPEPLFDFGASAISPQFSPDGRYVAFAANPRGNWDSFIYDRETQAFYALREESPAADIPRDWIP